MAGLRNGLYGIYYGSPFSQSEHLANEEMSVNASYIYSYLNANGWTVNSIAAILGNMQAESSINPGRWQSDDVGWESGGYGLVQWTPTTKYINWCYENGYNDPSEMDNNLARILYEVANKIQWIATSNYNFSFEEFTHSNENVGYLARAFLLNYERPADQSESVQNYRTSLANAWYEYLTGIKPNPPINRRKRSGYNFILFNRRRRMESAKTRVY